MPSRNSIKVYVAGGIYHVYNRGVEKRSIYIDETDFKTFLDLMSKSASAQRSNPQERWKRVEVLMYCLMPNHFHLIVRQSTERSLETFMRSLMAAYVFYFNRRYQRVGPLFQGPYKAVLITTPEQYDRVLEYVRRNPAEARLATSDSQYPYFRESPLGESP